jgi:phytoene dehydrogenase-like protein
MLLQALGGTLLYSYSSGSPRGGMHTYAHSIIRSAIANGARILTNSPVEEIIVRDGRARGVRLSDEAAFPEKTIWADRAVISGIDVQQTFLNLVGRQHLDASFTQEISDVSLKGGSLYVLSVICRELPRYHDNPEWFREEEYPATVVAPVDTMEHFHLQTRDAYSHKRAPDELTPEHLTMMICNHDVYDPTRTPEGYHVLSPIYLECPPPQYDVTGPDGYNNRKDEIAQAALKLLGDLAPNMRGANVVDYFVNTPQDSEFRNAGMTGGNWYAARQDTDQWFSTRPTAQLARYRTPIEGLYMCHQDMHPGGLALMAVPYNLMHILIEDGAVEARSWWYPSEWYMNESGSMANGSKAVAS